MKLKTAGVKIALSFVVLNLNISRQTYIKMIKIMILVCISESMFYSNGKVVKMRWLVFAIIVINPAL